jgi:hypothetical protein
MIRKLSPLAFGCFALTLLLPSGAARADAIDGHWCHPKDGRMSISGSDIVAPGGTRMLGNYGRHSFSYVVLAAEPGAGSTIQMVQLNEETIHVARDATGETPPQVWHRCQAAVS